MPDVLTAAPLTAEEIVALSKKHTIFEWSAQGAVDPIPVSHAKGCYFFTPDGRRFLDFNSQLMAVNIGHGDERVINAMHEQAKKLQYINPTLVSEPRARLGAKLAELGAWRHRRLLLHQWRCGCGRERGEAGAPLHRPAQDHGAVPLVPRCHCRRHDVDRRPTPVGKRAWHSRRGSRARPLPRRPARVGRCGDFPRDD